MQNILAFQITYLPTFVKLTFEALLLVGYGILISIPLILATETA